MCGDALAEDVYVTLIRAVIPMRNCRRTIRAALDSVFAQSGVELEVVVVDDGSMDESASVVRAVSDPRVRMVPGPCKGIAAALNTGLAEARGEFFCRCDADDLFVANRLRRQWKWLNDHSDFGAIAGAYATVNQDLEPVAEHVWKSLATEITQELRNGKGSTHLGTILVRMEHVKQLGGFRSYFIGTEDVDFVLRLAKSRASGTTRR